jgi:molecular chaperone Hsp33
LHKEPYRGSVPIVSGEIAEDLAHYLARSEQINSAVSIGVVMKLAGDGHADRAPGGALDARDSLAEFDLDRLRVSAAGGYVIQVLPSAPESLIKHLEEMIPRAAHATDMIRSGLGPAEMLAETLGDVDYRVLGVSQPRFFCSCSHQRALQIVGALGHEEVQDMLERDGGALLTCHFCNETYRISGEELSGLLEAD